MKIKRYEIHGLFGAQSPIIGEVNEDLNIITGRNGAGKTTVMKLLWYVMSGNILIALKEVEFRRVSIETDLYTVRIYKVSGNTCKIDWEDEDGRETIEDHYDEDGDYINAEDVINRRIMELGGSVFLPTFRRIEGGFTIGSEKASTPWGNSLLGAGRDKNPIENALQQLSKTLSNRGHIFVTAISTVDIATLLLQQFTDLSDQYAKLQQDTSQQVINNIKVYEDDPNGNNIDHASNTLLGIKMMIENLDVQREAIMTPIEAVRELVQKLIGKSGIKFNARISFGDAAKAINSEMLSAGEKQMLSFICYNAFYKNSVFFIDEPELSLHVDWQRQLFQILMDQQTSNQFIVATHSPFIYNKYPDKELSIDTDRGDSL